jgi:hypothetical protein
MTQREWHKATREKDMYHLENNAGGNKFET